MPDLSLRYASGAVHGEMLVVSITTDQIRDSTLAYALRDEIISLVEATKVRNVVLDLEKVHFIGSVGFLAFLGVRRHLGGGRIVLCNMSEPIRQMFAVCRLIPADTATTAPFEVEANLDAALLRLAS